MDSLNLKYIGILVQSFTIFVAISIFLGRIYSLSYFDALEIPVSEIRLNLAEYSVASPEVTIFGIGFSAILAVFFLFPWNSDSTPSFWWMRIGLGALIYALGASPLIFPFLYSVVSPDVDTLIIALLILLRSALMLFGAAVFKSGFFVHAPQAELFRALRNVTAPIIVALYIGSTLWLMTEFASTMGRVDATLDLAEAPKARIEFSAFSTESRQIYGSDEYGEDSPSEDFKVVLVGDKFIYLRLLADSEPSKGNLYALPIEDIASIAYSTD